MKKVKLLIFMIMCTVQATIIAQKEEKVRLYTHPNWEKLLSKKPKDGKKWQEFELFARMYARYAVPEGKVLPLVFNIIDINHSKKVTEKTIEDQLQIVNTAFAGKCENSTNRDYDSVLGGDTKISFCMGSPGGNVQSINTINRQSPYAFADIEKISDKKLGVEGAKKDEYINIWITELPDDIGGFAIMPDVDDSMEGVYIDPDYFGPRPESEQYKEGKTLIHLLGQYLGLKPLWAGNDCMDDGIEDTPVHNAPNYRCFGYSHITLCPGYGEEMIGNFMDATPDECAFMFTKGQVARMHATFTDKGYKGNLLKGKKLCTPDVSDGEVVLSRTDIKTLDFTIIPNPAKTHVEIIFQNPVKYDVMQIQIYDLTGKMLYDIIVPAIGEMRGKTNIDISGLESNTYIVHLKAGEKVVTKKLIKI